MTAILPPERIVGGTDLTVQLPAGTMRFQELRRGDWLTLKGEPAKKEHRGYWLDGEQLDSVSSIVGTLSKPGLEIWMQRHAAIGGAHAARMGELDGVPDEDIFDRVTMLGLGPEAARGEGAARGNAIHAAMHVYITTGEPPNPADYPAECRPWMQGAIRAALALDPVVICAEQIVCHPGQLYAGRFDLYAECGGLRTLVDYKTGKGVVHEGGHYQTRGYAECFEHCELDPPERIVIVGIDAEGGFDLVDCAVDAEDWAALVAVRQSRQRLSAAMSARAKAARAAAKAAVAA